MLRPWTADVLDTSHVPDVRLRTDRLVSPAHPADTADLSGTATSVPRAPVRRPAWAG